MTLKIYEFLVFLITAILSFEYLCLNKIISLPHLLPSYNPLPGYPLSYYFGVAGIVVMLLTNLYIIRKRLGFCKNVGKTEGWFNFHIFCGVLGPILIVFHTNFKVNGLVAISFWSMVICSTSGIIGRYFYLQTLHKKNEILSNINLIQENLSKYLSNNSYSDKEILTIFNDTRKFGGIPDDYDRQRGKFLKSLSNSIYCDLKIFLKNPGKKYHLSKQFEFDLKRYLILFKEMTYMDACNRFVGYWHSFHLPFAFFMYTVAIIHILSSMFFAVKH